MGPSAEHIEAQHVYKAASHLVQRRRWPSQTSSPSAGRSCPGPTPRTRAERKPGFNISLSLHSRLQEERDELRLLLATYLRTVKQTTRALRTELSLLLATYLLYRRLQAGRDRTVL